MGNEYKEEGFEFKPIIKVLEEIFAIIISQTRQFIRDWEIRLNNLLSENGQYILSQLLPECRDYLKYTSSENWHAFTNVNDPQAFETVQLFIRSFVSKQDPLAIFLQSSSASSKIFDFLCYMSNCKIQYLLFIVKTDGFESIRENDTQKLPTISRSTIIECKPLSINHVKDIISDIMRPISDDVTELAKFLSQNSQGVSGVILETLRLCESQGLIGYNKSKNTWSWDMEEIKRKISVADTFASHLLLHVDSLSSDTKSVLKRAGILN
jgi:predicted ATPase